MVTKSILLNQLPEYNSLGKRVRGVVSFSGDKTVKGKLTVLNLNEKKLKMLVKIGDKSSVLENISNLENYEFNLNLPMDDNISVLLASDKANCLVGIASGGCGAKTELSALFDELTDSEIDELVSKESDFEELKTLANEPLETSLDETKDKKNFYEIIKPQLDELFSRFPHFTVFEDRIPNSEWVKVNFSDDEAQHYLLGKLYENGLVSHIMYALPAQNKSKEPPIELNNLVQWMPLDISKPEDYGYWVMYQDSSDGENIIL